MRTATQPVFRVEEKSNSPKWMIALGANGLSAKIAQPTTGSCRTLVITAKRVANKVDKF